MFTFNALTLILITIASMTEAGPLKKRIAQTIADSTALWEQACLTAGGGQQCNPLSVSAMATLLAGAGPCDQQNAGDQMINLAKTLQSNSQMISLTQVFVQQPRNSPDSFSIPYCQQAPQNEELNGLFQCQFDGTSSTFVGNLQPGASGTVPFGLSSLKVAKSCPANPSGGIADGTQLNAITQNPGLNNIGNGGGSSSPSSAAPSGNSSPTPTDTVTQEIPSCSAAPPASNTGSSSDGNNSSSFQLQNGKDAQKLNSQFQSLTSSSSCTANEDACINNQFALCSNGQFVLMPCASGEQCAALPLVNKPGTTVTCTTNSDALARIAATGATGGLTGSDSDS